MSKKEAYDHTTLVVETEVKKGKKLAKEREILHINTRKFKPARQSISVSKEAYLYMVDGKEIPSPKVKREWGNYTTAQRLEWHLTKMAEALGAISFSYEILDD